MASLWSKPRFCGMVMACFFYQYLWVTKLCVKVGRSRIPRTAVAPKYFIVLWCVWMEPAPFRTTKNVFVMCESDRQFRHKVFPTSVNRILASKQKAEFINTSQTLWYHWMRYCSFYLEYVKWKVKIVPFSVVTEIKLNVLVKTSL